MAKLSINPISGSLGAEVTGIDVSDISDTDFELLEQVFHEYLVIAIRGQSLCPASLYALTERLGGVGDTPYLTGLSDWPDVVPIIKEANEKSGRSFGAGWHTDFTFQAHPPSRTLLYAVDTPPVGGDTLYSNLYKAYEILSPGMKRKLSGLNCVHSAIRSYGPDSTLGDHLENMEIHYDKQQPVEQIHPVVRQHPVTRQNALWINPTYSIRFEAMTEAESKPLLDYLNQLAVNPSLTSRLSWQPGTLAMWDNRCTQHCGTSDYKGHRREMLRTTVAGEIPVAAGTTQP